MAFPVFNNSQILFSDGAPAVSDNCCCGYYRTSYGPCCGTPQYGCRWPDAPISGTSYSYYRETNLTLPERFVETLEASQNGASYMQVDEHGCPVRMYIPLEGFYRYERWSIFGGKTHDITVNFDDGLAQYVPGVSFPRINDGTFIWSTPTIPSVIFGYPLSMLVDTLGECFGWKHAEEESPGFYTEVLDLYLDARRCPYDPPE